MLYELLTALAVAIILSLLAISSWQNVGHHDSALIATQKIAAGIRFARFQAILRKEPVIFCKSSDHLQCGGAWRDGQLVITQGGVVLQVLGALVAGDNLVWRSSFGRNDALELLPSGYTLGQQGRFYYCPAGQGVEEGAPILVVNQTGRVRIEWGSSNYCI